MRKGRTLGLMVVCFSLAAILSLAGCSKKAEVVAPTKIEFATSYEQALQLAQQKNQKLLIDFYTDWCTWCKRLDTVTFVDSAVIAMSNNIVFARINAEQDTITARKYGVSGYPTVVFANSDGTEIDRIAGFLPPPDFIGTITDYTNDIHTLNYYLRQADSGATNELNAIIGEKYADRGMYTEAEMYFQRIIDADPENKEGYTDKAMMAVADLKRRGKNFDDAMAIFGKVRKQFAGTEMATDAEIWTAICLRQKGDTTAAIKAFEDFIANNPASADTTYARQQIEKLKNPDTAGASN